VNPYPISRGNKSTPLILHLIYRLDVGGLENGLVNLINAMSAERYRHAIVCLSKYTSFRNRIRRPDVEVIELGKPPGQDWRLYGTLWRLFRQLQPTILHTRNLAGLEAQVPGFFAGIRRRVHSEHGLEMTALRYTLLRKALRNFVNVYIPLSKDLQRWLIERIGIPKSKIVQIYNGVDTDTFSPRAGKARSVLPEGFLPDNGIVVGTVGRLAQIKDQSNLIQSFARLIRRRPEFRSRLRLVIVGEGEMKVRLSEVLRTEKIDDITWMSGSREDVPDMLHSFDIFALPSISEGICNSVLEAMASGLPVIATQVGGNPELVVDGETGRLVPPRDPEALAAALAEYIESPFQIREHGEAGRKRCVRFFSIARMVESYLAVYDSLVKTQQSPLNSWHRKPDSRLS
jgi:sugar transferase (PEP-CTERM/EpsH1 system associated)